MPHFVQQQVAQVTMIATGSKSLSCFKSIFKTPNQHKKFFCVTVFLILFYTCTGKYVNNDQFDYLIFSQRWLPTACIEYIEHHSRPYDQHQCIKPQNFASWAIHGLWPTQNNHMGPFFCNTSIAFDVTKLIPIESELKKNWPNIEEGKRVGSLWQHEWMKHGTCASQLDSLNSELKYFNATLKFFKTINLQSVLVKNGILPKHDKGINVTDLFYVIRNTFGKLPQVHCINEVKTKLPYLHEIRFCYNKNLELIDCRKINRNKLNENLDVGNLLTNCPLNLEVMYPPSVSSKLNKLSLENSSKMNYYDTLVDILSIIRFLQWASI